MNALQQTREFVVWLNRLQDAKGKARIVSRLRLATLGNFGDSAPVGEGVSEMRVDFGPGYRVYFFRRELQTYAVVLGGNKSTQERDIKRAKQLAQELKKETSYAKGKK